ncbi:copine family protein [Tanacetum coccineum]
MMASVTIRATEVTALAAKKVVQKYSHTIESCICYCLATTHGQHVLSFYPEDRSCNAFEDAMSRCRENGTQLMLAGQRSFTLLIEQAMTIVGKVGGQYHVLLIFADGQAGNGTLQSKSRCCNMKKDTKLATN